MMDGSNSVTVCEYLEASFETIAAEIGTEWHYLIPFASNSPINVLTSALNFSGQKPFILPLLEEWFIDGSISSYQHYAMPEVFLMQPSLEGTRYECMKKNASGIIHFYETDSWPFSLYCNAEANRIIKTPKITQFNLVENYFPSSKIVPLDTEEFGGPHSKDKFLRRIKSRVFSPYYFGS